MTYAREPVLQPVPIESLRPTQITVGMREVEEKRKRLRKQKPRKVGSFIGRHMIPVVLGTKKRHYVIAGLVRPQGRRVIAPNVLLPARLGHISARRRRH